MTEQPIILGADASRVGVLALPDEIPVDPARPVLLLLNAGLVHRVGPHRLYVNVARHLARQGFASLRFDFSGIGDSLPRSDSLPYRESTLAETTQAMDMLAERLGARRFCLAGLSSGALVSMAAAGDPRVAGVALLNPHGFAESAELGAHVAQQSQGRIYAQNLFRFDSWLRLVSGKTDYRRLGRALAYRLRPRRDGQVDTVAAEARQELLAFFGLPKYILLLLSEQDRSLDNFSEILGPRWQQQLGGHVETVVLPHANHTFAGPVHGRQAVEAMERWMLAHWDRETRGCSGD
jgi:pimeloyl-ACP methyl ester carboxylesterase